MKIAVAGTGYVGLSIATLLAQNHEVIALDINRARIDKINRRELPIEDSEIEKFFKEKSLNLTATLNGDSRQGSRIHRRVDCHRCNANRLQPENKLLRHQQR